jgi:hypothetical protein
MVKDTTLLEGEVEADETFIGGKPRAGKPMTRQEHADRKTVVIGAVERGGRVRASVAHFRADAHAHVRETGTRAIATWAMKVAIVRQYLDPPPQHAIDGEQRHQFRQTSEPPDGTLILAAPIWRGAQRWPARDRRRTMGSIVDDRFPDHANMHITTFGVGRVAFFVAGSSPVVPTLDLSQLAPGTFVRIWPDPRAFMWPPPEALTDADLDVLSGDDPSYIFPAINVV